MDYRVEIVKGKKRRLYPRNCEECSEVMWVPTYYKKRFCKPLCHIAHRRAKWKGIDLNKQSYCPKCDSVKHKDQFRENTSKVTGVQAWCRVCEDRNKARWYRDNTALSKERVKARKIRLRTEAREWVINYFVDHPCIDCGETDIVVLDFDHVHGTKSFNVSHMMTGEHPLELLIEEVSKCVVRCSNCHRRKTAKERESWRTKV